MAIVTVEKGYAVWELNSEEHEAIQIGRFSKFPFGQAALLALASTLGEARLIAKQYQSKHPNLGIDLL